MVSIARIGVFLTYQWIQSFLFFDLMWKADPYHIKFSIGLVMFILSYLWSAYHLLKDHRQAIYVFNLALYTISQTVLLLSLDAAAHFMASVISFLAALLTAVSKKSFTESVPVYNAKFDLSWIRLGHLLSNIMTALFLFFVDPASFDAFSIWGFLCALQLVHLHPLEWDATKIISNLLCFGGLFLFNVYISDMISFGKMQALTYLGFCLLAIVTTSFRCLLKITDYPSLNAPGNGFIMFLLVLALACLELIVKSHVAPVQQLDFWSFLCVTLVITSILAFVSYWDNLCYTYLYLLALAFVYCFSIGLIWLLFHGDPFQNPKILWFTPLVLLLIPLVYRLVRFE